MHNILVCVFVTLGRGKTRILVIDQETFAEAHPAYTRRTLFKLALSSLLGIHIHSLTSSLFATADDDNTSSHDAISDLKEQPQLIRWMTDRKSFLATGISHQPRNSLLHRERDKALKSPLP